MELRDLETLFSALQAHAPAMGRTRAAQRIARLRALKKALYLHQPEAHAALRADLNRAEPDTDLNEILPVTTSIDYTIRHLRRWMRPEKHGLPFTLIPG